MTTSELRRRIAALQAERMDAADHGLGRVGPYMADLDHELDACRQAYVGAAVTEIATLRAQLSGPQGG